MDNTKQKTESNMKKIMYAAVAASVLAFTACDDMLDTINYQAADSSTWPATQEDATQCVNGIYNALMLTVCSDVEQHNFYLHMVASDDIYGAGSTSSTGAEAADRLMWDENDGMTNNWANLYKGVYRANFALEKIPGMQDDVFESADAKNYLVGQAYFLRAWYFWELAQGFETFPLKVNTAQENLPRASVDEIYTQLAEDLTKAIELMPAKYGYSTVAGYAGRATKYAAEALMARIWLFYTGFYGKSEMFGVTKDKVVAYLKDCRDNSGFKLEKDPREIWPYTNEYSSGVAYGTPEVDSYVVKNDLHWVGNHSQETIWACHFSLVYGTFSNSCNRLGEYMGLRNSASSPDDKCYPYGIGYSNGSVNTKMVEEWATDPDYGQADKRLWGSILTVDEASSLFGTGGSEGEWMGDTPTELPNHVGNDSKEVEKTMFHNKKYNVIAGKDAQGVIKANFFYVVPGTNCVNSNQADNRNDLIFIRFADVLLMLDELQGTVDGMNALRSRAGLAPYSGYTFERLQKERRYEFCFEALRFNDLRRWYPQDAGKVISQNQVGGYIQYRGKKVANGYMENPGNGMDKRYKETRGFWRIPQTQITVSEDVLVQTPGWENDKSSDWFFSNGSLPYNK